MGLGELEHKSTSRIGNKSDIDYKYALLFCTERFKDFLRRKVTKKEILRYTKVGFFYFLCSVLCP